MAPEGFQGCRGELHGATAGFGLRSPEHRATLRGGQRASHLQRSGLKVYVLPLEAEQLTLPQPGVDGKDVEGFEPVVYRLVEGLVQCDVDVLDSARRESRLQFLPVEPSYVGWGQVLELHAS